MTNMVIRSYQIHKQPRFEMNMHLELTVEGWSEFYQKISERLSVKKEWSLRIPKQFFQVHDEQSGTYSEHDFTVFWKIKPAGAARSLIAHASEKSWVATLCFSEEGFEYFKNTFLECGEYSFSSNQQIDSVSNFHIVLKKEIKGF